MKRIHFAICELAQWHGLGSVGVAGAYATGTASDSDKLQLLVCVPIDRAAAFARELSERLQLTVQLYDVHRLPWASHLHLCVAWLNVDTLPRVPYPRGAVARVQIGELSGLAPLENVPHLEPIDGPLPPRKSGPFTAIYRAPMGGFLI